jgi:hypothetical protein
MAVAPVSVIVNNNSSAQVKTEESTGSNGERVITQTIIDTVAGSMGPGGKLNRTMKSTFSGVRNRSY